MMITKITITTITMVADVVGGIETTSPAMTWRQGIATLGHHLVNRENKKL